MKSKLTTRKRVRVSASGKFTAKFAVGTFFRADAAATGAGDPALCAKLQPLIGTVPCVNPTVNGFVDQEQGRQEEVATSQACTGAGPHDRPLCRVSYGWYCWSIESTGFGYLSPTRIQ